LGQNFVADPNTVRRIARLAALGPGAPVLEIGAGLGSLTLALAETGARVVAVELDRYLLPVLRSVVEPAGVEVVAGDAMTLDIAGLLAERGGGAWSLVANLPYNVATPLVLRTLVEVPAVERLLVMVQREVGERMAATVGDPAYGSVSVRVAYFARSSLVGKVPASVFIPRPRVESVLVRLERRPEVAVDPAEVSYRRLAAVVKAGFGQRRKMLRRSLAGVVEPEAFARAGVRPDARAEELTVEQWGRLAR
jgi:16S rRNA (adenine1518-N6/adenine1519-N6)-dimethyltransferase